MASVFARGPRSAPRFYARFKAADGKWVSRRVRQTTRKDALRVAQALEARAERVRVGLEAPEAAGALCGPLLRRWGAQLANRSAATDLCRLDLHVLPRWSSVRVAAIDLAAVMSWLDDLRDAADVGPATQRHLLGLLSRFLSWCTERGFAPRNVCRDIPPGRRPRAVPVRDVPWVRTDADALAIFRALPAPFDLVFYVGFTSGLRLSEITGLRISDLDELAAGVVRVRFAGDDGTGPLKEDRDGGGKVKFAPAPVDAVAVIGPHVEGRRAASAGPEAFLFVGQDGEHVDRHAVGYRWREAARALGLPEGLSFYRATRHSFVSRASAAGASIDEVSAAVGHASTATTMRHYMHHVRRSWSPALHAGLGLDGRPGAKVLRLSQPSASAEVVDGEDRRAEPAQGGNHAVG